MTLEDFEDGLDRWGGALAAWPPDQRAAANLLLASSPQARASLAAMQAVEGGLARTAYRSPADTGHVVARATLQRQDRPARSGAWRWRAAACAVLLAAGFAYGALDRPSVMDDWFGPAFNAADPLDVG